MRRLNKILFLLAIAFFTCLAPLPIGAFETDKRDAGPVSIEADSIAYNGDDDSFHAAGKVLITFSGGDLKADAVTLYRGTNQALAVGHVFLRNNQDILEGEKVLFNIDSRTGTVDEGRMFIAGNHFYVRGEKIEKKSEAAYRLENGTVTTCDGDNPDWRLAGKEVDLTVDGYGTVKHCRFLAGDLPVFYVPYLIFPAKTTRQTGFLLPRLGYSRDKNGLDVEIPFYWAISEGADATFFQRYLEKRGFKEGVEFRYASGADSFGVFYGDFINDSKRVTEGVGTMSRDWQDDRNRWSYYLNNETTFGDGISLRSDIRRVSDRWYFKDFSSFNYYLDHYSPGGEERFSRVSFLGDESLGALDSTVRLTKDWSLYNLTALARYTDDFSSSDNNGTLQKYPEATLTGFRQPLFGSPLQLEFSAGYDHFFRQEGQKGHLWQVSPTLLLPLKMGPYAQVTPQAGFRGDVWERSDSVTDTGDKQGNREIFTLGTTLSTEIHRIFDVQGAAKNVIPEGIPSNVVPGGSPLNVIPEGPYRGYGFEEVEKIRHGIRPELTYNFIPDASQDRAPDFLEPIPAQHSLTYAVTNTFLARMRAKDGKVRYREMMRFKIGQTYDIREARRDATGAGNDNRPFRDVDLELDFSPLPYLSLSARNKFDVNSGNWRQNNYDLTLSDYRGDSVSAGYRYTRDRLEEINLYMRAVLTSSLGVTYLLRRNQLDRRTVESAYGLQYRKQCWNVALNVSDRPDDMTVMVVFSLYGMGK